MFLARNRPAKYGEKSLARHLGLPDMLEEGPRRTVMFLNGPSVTQPPPVRPGTPDPPPESTKGPLPPKP